MDDARTRLLDRLDGLGVVIEIVPYPEAPTLEEGKRLRGEMVGTTTRPAACGPRVRDRLSQSWFGQGEIAATLKRL